MKLTLIKSFVIAISLTLSVPVSAQVLMEPSKVELKVRAGETVLDHIKLHNRTNHTVYMKAYWQDFDYEPPFRSKKKFMPVGSSKYSFHEWINFSPQKITIPPKGMIIIDYSIRIPQDSHGGYTGVLFFESEPPPGTGPTGVSIITRLGVLFFLDSVDSDKTSKISSMVAIENGIQGTFSNLGNVILKPKVTYYTLNPEGMVLDRGEMEDIRLPPKKETTFDINFRDNLEQGLYTTIMTFDLGDGFSAVKEVDFLKGQSEIVIKEVRD